MLKLQGTVLRIGTPQDIIPAPEVIQVDLSLFLVDRTRIKNVLLSSFPSFLVIFQNAENILGFLLNSPRPHLKHNKSLGAQDFPSGLAWKTSGQGQTQPASLELPAPCGPLKMLLWLWFWLPEFSYSAWYCRYYTPVPALKCDMLKCGDTLSTWSLRVIAKRLTFLF